MRLRVLSLNTDKNLPVAKLQARMFGSFNSFSDEDVIVENFESLKELFPSLSDALKTSEVVVLALDTSIMAKAKLKLLAALSLKTHIDSEIMNRLDKMTSLSTEEKELIAKIPLGSVPFLTDDGINSGFVIKKGKQKIIFIPLDNDRIDSVLRNGVVPYLMTGGVAKPIVAHGNDTMPYIAPVDSEDAISFDTVLRTVNILRDSGMSVSFNSNANSEIIKNSGSEIEDFSDCFVFTPSVGDRGNYNITDYTAQMAKSSKELTTSTFGASISDVCDADGVKYICIAVATDKSAVVRKLYMESDEAEDFFRKEAAEELVELIGEKASGAGLVGIEISEETAPQKQSFLSKKSGKITLSIIALLLVAAVITGVILLKKQQAKVAETTTAPITTVPTTEPPTTLAPVVEVTKLSFSEFMYKEATEGVKEEKAVAGDTQGTTAAAGATTENNADALPANITVNGEKLDAKTAIAKIVAAEMDDSYETEAIKAQAVVIYTYIKYRDTGWSITGVKTADKYSDKIYNAVKAVFGEYIKAGNEVAYTPYHLISAGKTTTSKLAFSKPFSYLKVVDVPSDKQEDKYETTKTYTDAQMKEMINKYDSKIKLSENVDEWIKVTKHDSAVSTAAGYVETIKVGGTEISGVQFMRGVIGTENLPSHCFTVNYDKVKKNFTITAYGSGYGVGMSQKAANKMAKAKSTYKTILTKFYAGTSIIA